MILLGIGLFVAFLLWYVLAGRAWLKAKPWAWSQAFFAFIEPIEIKLWRKSETLLMARFLMLAGMIPPLLDQVDALKPLFEQVAPYLPGNWQSYISLTLTVLGLIGEIQRRYTTKPLEIVALPEAVAAAMPAVVAAEAAKVEAVAVVKVEAAAVAQEQAAAKE